MFQEYCKWIYSGVIPPLQGERAGLTVQEKLCINLYLLGDTLDDMQLRNLATLQMCKSLEMCDALPTATSLAVVYSSIGSYFRKQLVDYTVARTSRDQLEGRLSLYPPEYVQEVAMASLHKALITTWKCVAGDGTAYLEPEDKSTT